MYDRDEESTQGLEIQLLDPSHLFRHASEITKGKKSIFCIFINSSNHNVKLTFMTNKLHYSFSLFPETKGGYLQGKIFLPKIVDQMKGGGDKNNYFLRISLGPADIDPESNPLHIHPWLLYLNTRQIRKKRQFKVQ